MLVLVPRHLELAPGRWSLADGAGVYLRVTRASHDCLVPMAGAALTIDSEDGTYELTVRARLAGATCSRPGHPPEVGPATLPAHTPDLLFLADRCIFTGDGLVAPGTLMVGAEGRPAELSGTAARVDDHGLAVRLHASAHRADLARDPQVLLAGRVSLHCDGVLRPQIREATG